MNFVPDRVFWEVINGLHNTDIILGLAAGLSIVVIFGLTILLNQLYKRVKSLEGIYEGHQRIRMKSIEEIRDEIAEVNANLKTKEGGIG